ncbi:TPA: hypothetical protein NJ328_002883 [Vibrio parahaemolyticus]|uniref:hypothetical protein n=1 Tax=Vibrio harveyi group TaxID=717610 RepID=UPI001E3AE0FD|nr:hypothetical protein [Vibrio parahaemolyticus]ELY1986598.1 hypothetical protein [Vibrio harveyi]EHZ2726888.1 hypothetical protein [Vibrio parahaemolyticus]EIV1599411.1 hypothetical protein [Vibrio parahaemolyticus]EJG1820385.1 hypothetical protein [Vibrio parahaemolyticus]MBE4473692.1 hypothetical protein [Vibrio parahaemolyticus]
MSKKENAKKVGKWLRENADPKLSETRTGGDEPAVEEDREYLNRSELYEVRDVIVRYIDEAKKSYSDTICKNAYNKIKDFRPGSKVKTQDFLDHLLGKVDK